MANNLPSGARVTPGRTALGWIAQTDPTTATTATTTEVMHATVTANLNTGRRYKIQYRGCGQSSVAGDRTTMKYRIASGASVTISSTLMRTIVADADVAARNNPVVFDHVFTVATAQQWTVGISIIRASGTGTVKLDAFAGLVEPMLLLEDIGAS